jgi:hypothetical protein
MLLTAKLAVPQWLPPQEDGPQIAIEMTGACVLPNARPGIWITGTRAHLIATQFLASLQFWLIKLFR